MTHIAPHKLTGNQKNTYGKHLHKPAQSHPSKKHSDDKDLGQPHPFQLLNSISLSFPWYITEVWEWLCIHGSVKNQSNV